VAPSLCACTAFKLASLIETPGAFRLLRPPRSPPRGAVVLAGLASLSDLPGTGRKRFAVDTTGVMYSGATTASVHPDAVPLAIRHNLRVWLLPSFYHDLPGLTGARSGLQTNQAADD
jgi:hypothetical protein